MFNILKFKLGSTIDHPFYSLRSLSSIALLAKAERQGEEMNTDWYEFNGLPKDQIGRARVFNCDDTVKMTIDNEDWTIIFDAQDSSQDQDLNRITIYLFSEHTVRCVPHKFSQFKSLFVGYGS